MEEIEDRLDRALEGYLKGDGGSGDEFASQMSVLRALAPLGEVPPRDPRAAAAGRLAFLKQARSITPPVSAAPIRRLMGRMLAIRKEKPVMGTLLSVLLAIGLTFGGAGVTVAAAQESMPSDVLYPAKTWFEDIRLALMGDPESKLDLLLDFAGERVREITTMAQAGDLVPEEVPVRLQEQLELALQEANRLQGEAQAQALERIRTASMVHTQALERLNLGEGTGLQEIVQAAIQALTQTQTRAEGAITDPNLLRDREGLQRPETAPTQPEKTPQQGQDSEPGGQGPDGGEGPQGPGSEEPGPDGDSGQEGSGPNDDPGGPMHQGKQGP